MSSNYDQVDWPPERIEMQPRYIGNDPLHKNDSLTAGTNGQPGGSFPSAYAAPRWTRSADLQLDRADRLWPGVRMPDPPPYYTPATDTEVLLLLGAPMTLESLWYLVEPPRGYTKSIQRGFSFSNLVCANNTPDGKPMHARTEPAWVGFDIEHGAGKRPSSFWGTSTQMAGTEVLSALIQFPALAEELSIGLTSTPNLTAFKMKGPRGYLTRVPYVSRSLGKRRLELRYHWASTALAEYSSPKVRLL